MKQKTLIIIKPHAIEHSGSIWAILKNNGFGILTVKKVQFPIKLAEHLHFIQQEFKPVSDFKQSGECMIAILEKENAIRDSLKIAGNRNPTYAEAGTIRALFASPDLYAQTGSENTIHVSDCEETAELEIQLLYNEYSDL